jgi:putative transposase
VKRLVRVRRARKSENECAHAADSLLALDSRIEMIQALIPLGLEALKEELTKAVDELVGPRYQRGPADRQFYRWGSENGSVYLADQKIPVQVPRVRDVHRNQEVRLSPYDRLQLPRGADKQLMLRILRGLGCRNYQETAALVPEAFGMSASTVSRRFIRATERRLKELTDRKLSKHDFLAVFLDGKAFGDDEMVIAVGITITGEKVILGMVQTAGENATVCKEFLESLVARGLRYEAGLLAVVDGAKGFHRAVREVFGGCALIQRCRWHKRENVLKYLALSRRAAMRRKIQAAYQEPDYEKAKASLQRTMKELKLQNASAAASLAEGLEETLTLHRLGLAAELGLSFSTTNVIESIQAHIARLTDHVDHFRNSDQKHRWIGTALLEIEPKLRKVKGRHHLKALREALQKELGIKKRQAAA